MLLYTRCRFKDTAFFLLFINDIFFFIFRNPSPWDELWPEPLGERLDQ